MPFSQEPPAEAMKKRVPAEKRTKELSDKLNYLADKVNDFYLPDTGQDMEADPDLHQAKRDLGYSMDKMHEALVALVWSGPDLPRGKRPAENWSMFYSYKRCYETLQELVGGFHPPAVARNVKNLYQRAEAFSEAVEQDGFKPGDIVVVTPKGKSWADVEDSSSVWYSSPLKRYVGSIRQVDTASSAKPLYQVDLNKAYDTVDSVWVGADKLVRPKAVDIGGLYSLMRRKENEAGSVKEDADVPEDKEKSFEIGDVVAFDIKQGPVKQPVDGHERVVASIVNVSPGIQQDAYALEVHNAYNVECNYWVDADQVEVPTTEDIETLESLILKGFDVA